MLRFSKGIAILLIASHHFAWSIWLSRGEPLPAMMQWDFDPAGERWAALISDFSAGRISDLILRFFAQFGYFGVHIFVLMSGIGLAFGTPEDTDARRFLKRRFRKLIPPFWTAVAFFALLRLAVGQPYRPGQVIERLFLLTTFDHSNFFRVDPPLWCMALFFQLYFLFLPMRRWIVRFGPAVLLPFVLISFTSRWLASQPPVFRWNHNFDHVQGLNWLVVFGMGIWIGERLRKDREVSFSLPLTFGAIMAGAIVLCLSETFEEVYPIHDTAIGVLMGALILTAFAVLRNTHPAFILSAVGTVSFPLYLYHRPIVGIVVMLWREIPHGSLVPPLLLGVATLVALAALFIKIDQVLHVRHKARSRVFGVEVSTLLGYGKPRVRGRAALQKGQ